MDLGDHTWKLARKLGTLRKKGYWTDVTLRVGGRAFGAHKIVLAAGSDRFRDVLKEESVEFSYPQFDADVFERILDFIYGEATIELNDIRKEFEFARQSHWFRVNGVHKQAILYWDTIPAEHLAEYHRLIKLFYPDTMPECHKEILNTTIENGGDLSTLTDRTIKDLLLEIDYHPKNLLEFHQRIVKLMERGPTHLFDLINYQLIPEEYRPAGRTERGPIPSFKPNEMEAMNNYKKVIVVGEAYGRDRYHASPHWNWDQYLTLDKVPVAWPDGRTEDILLNINGDYRVGDILVIDHFEMHCGLVQWNCR